MPETGIPIRSHRKICHKNAAHPGGISISSTYIISIIISIQELLSIPIMFYNIINILIPASA